MQQSPPSLSFLSTWISHCFSLLHLQLHATLTPLACTHSLQLLPAITVTRYRATNEPCSSSFDSPRTLLLPCKRVGIRHPRPATTAAPIEPIASFSSLSSSPLWLCSSPHHPFHCLHRSSSTAHHPTPGPSSPSSSLQQHMHMPSLFFYFSLYTVVSDLA